ncbi:hypothetical protein MTO96_025134 [Rhipicephalus appendiculatus]
MRVRTHGVELIQARMIGDTKSATLTFSGPILPKVVYYYGGELVCHPFRATVQVCKLCRVRGHRTDVCPHPDRQICRMCGLENPSPEHPCELKCASCGGPHATGDRSCTKRLKKPTAPRTPRPSRPQGARQARWFSSEDEEEARGRTTSLERRATSCSRSPIEVLLQIGAALSSNRCGRVIDAHADASPTTASGEKRETPAHNLGPESRSSAMLEWKTWAAISFSCWRTSPTTFLCTDLVRPHNVADVLNLAEKLELSQLRAHCVKVLERDLKPETCIGTYHLASSRGYASLTRGAFRCLVRNFDQVWKKNTHFERLTPEEIRTILEDDQLHAPNEVDDAFAALLKWIHADVAARKCYLAKFLPLLRLGLVDFEKVITNPEVQGDGDCLKVLNVIHQSTTRKSMALDKVAGNGSVPQDVVDAPHSKGYHLRCRRMDRERHQQHAHVPLSRTKVA